MPRPWRLIAGGPAGTGAWNMAVDRVLMLSRAAGAPPALRVYGWAAPTASLGRFQPDSDVDAEACARLGIDVVRRPSGGRGVLHDDEVTYSVAAAVEDGVPRGVTASYAHLGSGLAAAYRLLGVPAEVVGAHGGRRGSAACYLSATQADLALGGAKVAGSAQVWEEDVCLQHGSFVLTRDVSREAEVFRLTPGAERELASCTVTLAQALGARPDPLDVAAAIPAGFAEALGMTVEPDTLTADELREVSALAPSFAVAPARDDTADT